VGDEAFVGLGFGEEVEGGGRVGYGVEGGGVDAAVVVQRNPPLFSLHRHSQRNFGFFHHPFDLLHPHIMDSPKCL